MHNQGIKVDIGKEKKKGSKTKLSKYTKEEYVPVFRNHIRDKQGEIGRVVETLYQ